MMATFVPPSADERSKALGALTGLPRRLRAFLRPDEGFRPIVAPGHGDWLDLHIEPGQTYEEFTREIGVPDSAARCMYLLPLEGPSSVPPECLTRLRRFVQAFFSVEVRELAPWNVHDGSVARRTDPEWGLYQLSAPEILNGVMARRPDDALCVLAITTADLFPHPLVDYSFGLASHVERVGVCSLARFSPPYCAEAESTDGKVACRACRLIAHETGHVLGLRHCVYYTCLMNGSATVVEADTRPLHLCPIDLRKLHWLIGFDLEERYERLADLWREVRAEAEAVWVGQRLANGRRALSRG